MKRFQKIVETLKNRFKAFLARFRKPQATPVPEPSPEVIVGSPKQPETHPEVHPELSPVTSAWLASGNPAGAGASGGSPVESTSQPEFRDGNVHVFDASNSKWVLVADHDCSVSFEGGEAGGNVPGMISVSVAVNDDLKSLTTTQSTLYSISPVKVRTGDKIVLTITGNPHMVVMARLGVQ